MHSGGIVEHSAEIFLSGESIFPKEFWKELLDSSEELNESKESLDNLWGLSIQIKADVDNFGETLKKVAAIQKSSMVPNLKQACEGLESLVEFPCECDWHPGLAPVYDIIVHLNDNMQWDRERIADWLETLDTSLEIRMNDERNEE